MHIRGIRGIRGISDDGIVTEDGVPFDWGNAITRAQALYNSQKIFDLNVKRAEQGLPLIDASAVAPRINVGVNPQTQQLVLFGMAALVGVLLLRKRR